MYTRRAFLKTSTLAGAAGLTGGFSGIFSSCAFEPKKITIQDVGADFEQEPLLRPFGFKGGYSTVEWQAISMIQSASGIKKVGLASQGVRWSDSTVADSHSESGGDSLMFALTDYALKILKGRSFYNPVDLLDEIFPEVYEFGKKLTANPGLKKTFALNALVSVDNALWMLYAAENGIASFDDLIPKKYRPGLSHHHSKVACIPLMTYLVPISEIVQAADEGYFFMKIKIGQPGTQEEMLAKDMERVSAIHQAIGHYETPHTKTGKLPYYFDANGRYESKETLLRLIDHIQKIGAYDQIAIIEEPFPEELEVDVSDIPLRLASDESAHSDVEARTRIQMGYRALALKAIAKTMSMTMKIATVAKELNVPCFCADLTVSPILIDWNKNVAARLDPFPGLGTGLLETNGHQNYKNWSVMESYHPYPDAGWRKVQQGVFHLDKDFYEKSGGILSDSKHYMDMFPEKHT